MTSLHLTLPDYVVVLGYFVVVLWVGFYFKKRQVAAKDYFAGGYQVPWWLAGISHYMSSFSAFAFIAYSQIGYAYGWVAVTLFWASVPACILGGRIFARRWRRARIITPVEFLERRFNCFTRQLFAWAGIPVKVFDDALKIFATGLFLSVGIGIELKISIVLCGAVLVAYTFLGGLWALVVTDYVQFLLKSLAILLLFPLAVWQAGGPVAAVRSVPSNLLHLSGGPYGWIYILGFTVLMVMSYNGSWALAQKYYSVPDERSATKAAYLAAALNLVGAPVLIFPALIGRAILPDLIAQRRTADVYVLLVLKLLPVGMVGVIVAAMFSATMATVSADLNAIASVLTKDVYHRLINPRAGETGLVRVGRVTTLILGVLTVALSLWVALSQHESLLHVMVTAFGLLLAPTLLPLLAGLTVRWLTWKGALAGFVTGFISGVAMLAIKTWYLPRVAGVSPEWANYTFEGISILVNTGFTCLAMWAGSFWFARDAEEQARVRDFFRALDRPITPQEAPTTQGVSPLRPIGGSTLVVGGLLILAGLLSQSVTARVTDVALGILLAAIGVGLFRRAPAVSEPEVRTAAVNSKQ